MRGIILAGGKGTRLLPATRLYNKHLVAVLNDPMIVYPLFTLKSFGVEDILIVSGGEHIGGFAEFLGDGSEYGVNLTYRVQKEAGGIAQALGLAEDFAASEGVAVILGDNVFENAGLITPPKELKDHALIYLKEVEDARRFGVAVFENNDTNSGLVCIEEKPNEPKSNLAVTGLYYYPKDVFEVVKTLKPSARGEIEISDVNNFYVRERRLSYQRVPGFWSDAGTPESLFRASKWAMEKKYGIK